MLSTRSGNGIVVEAGSVLGSCTASTNKCTLENVVNMASVTFTGSNIISIRIGGISGFMCGSTNEAYIKNCVNYGAVTHSGSSLSYIHLGGIVGDSDNGKGFYNCLNSGNASFASYVSTTNIWIGGILGEATTNTITFHNCVNTGVISNTQYYGYVGNIGGDINANSVTFSYVYWEESRTGTNSICGLVGSHTLNNYGALSSSNYDNAISALNTQATINSWSKWMYNPYEKNANFSINERSGFVLSSKIILYPSLAACGSLKFEGWYNDTYNNKVDMPAKITADTTKYSFYGAAIVTITFETDYGSISQTSKYGAYNSKYSELPSPTRTGYTLVGWFTAASGGTQVTTLTTITSQSDHTLYARWTPNNYTVEFDVNGGDNVSQELKNVYYDSTYGTLPTANRTGYSFDGWFTDASVGAEIIETTKVEITTNQTLYAHWTANNYIVAFDVNGGNEFTEEGDKNKTVTYDSIYDCLPSPTRTGYSFTDWFNEDGEIVTNTTTINISCDQTLHAGWKANTYVIEFDTCGGDDVISTTVTYDSNYNCLPTPSREGYTFLWWYIKDTNEKVYNKTTVLTAHNHVLCAAWDRNTIIFDVNGGNELTDDEKKKEITYSGTSNSFPSPTRTGYTFDGWYTDGGVKVSDNSEITLTGDQTLHAKWTPNSYTMPLDVNGGNALTDSSVTVTYQSPYGTLPTPTKEGYTFVGWYTENDELITINTIATDPCHCTLRAEWAPNTYTIMFASNGGNKLNENEAGIEVTYGDTYGLFPSPTRTGYTFTGWLDGNGNEITTGMNVDVAGNQTFTAEWIPNEYTVEFKPSGCGEAIEEEEEEKEMEKDEKMEITVTYDAPYDSLPTPTTMKAGYEFDGWFTEDGELITSETKVEVADNHTLCAEWAPSNYAVKFDVNGGDELADGEKEMRVTYGGTYDSLPTPTRKGFKFIGWFSDDGNEEITAETVVETPEDQTLYAHWEEIVASQINIVFGKKDLSEEEIKETIKIFTDAEFTIVGIETNEAGETIVIIKFVDDTEAEEFFRKIVKSSNNAKDYIRGTYSSAKVEASKSTWAHPFMVLNYLLI